MKRGLQGRMASRAGALLAAAATLLAAQASAADLPTSKAAPVEGVVVCNVGGMAGFAIPGSSACLKLSGYVSGQAQIGALAKQYQLGFTGTDGASPVTIAPGASIASRDSFGMTSRAQLNIDVRQPTAYGDLRVYTEFEATNSSGFEASTQGFIVNFAYIQWAGLTAGRASSLFSYLGAGPAWYAFYSPDRLGSNQPTLLAYTARFGDGFSATASLEETTGARTNGPIDGGFSNIYYGVRYPDFVGAVRVDQHWGSAQLSAVAHNTHVLGVSDDSTDIWGYAALAGVTFNLPWLAQGDYVAGQAVYSRAALAYSGIPNTPLSVVDQGFNINGNGVIYQLTDALNYDIGRWSTPTAVTASALFNHYLTPQIFVTSEISYADVRYSGSPVQISARAESWIGGLTVHWDPVPHLDFSLGAIGQTTHQATPASYLAPPDFRPNSSGVAGSFAITRDF
jgi:hypothetical protein